jgi:hypothetical protein
MIYSFKQWLAVPVVIALGVAAYAAGLNGGYATAEPW